jgi:polar amino acid transport system substrate-binding protein
MKKTLITLLMVMAIATTTIFAQGAKETSAEADKVIVMASNAEWPPLEFVDENGEVVGFEIDLLKELEGVTDYTFEVKNVSWDGIFAGLANGAYDGVISGVSVTDERKKSMSFSDVFLNINQSIISLSSNENPSTNLESLVSKKAGVLIGSTSDILLQDSGLDIDIMSYDSIALAVEDLINGNLECVLTDSVVAGEYVVTNKAFEGKLKITGDLDGVSEPIAMCFNKDDSFHTEIVNAGLKILTENGTLDKLYKKWAIF